MTRTKAKRLLVDISLALSLANTFVIIPTIIGIESAKRYGGAVGAVVFVAAIALAASMVAGLDVVVMEYRSRR